MTFQPAEARDDYNVQRHYKNDDITVHWEPGLCIHSAYCLRLFDVFDPKARPWVRVDGADAEQIAAVIESCPTSALTYERTDGGPQEEAPPTTTVEPRPNGPLFVRGRIRIDGPEGEREVMRAALCRCGASTNKPFCDLSHRRIDFKA